MTPTSLSKSSTRQTVDESTRRIEAAHLRLGQSLKSRAQALGERRTVCKNQKSSRSSMCSGTESSHSTSWAPTRLASRHWGPSQLMRLSEEHLKAQAMLSTLIRKPRPAWTPLVVSVWLKSTKTRKQASKASKPPSKLTKSHEPPAHLKLSTLKCSLDTCLGAPPDFRLPRSTSLDARSSSPRGSVRNLSTKQLSQVQFDRVTHLTTWQWLIKVARLLTTKAVDSPTIARHRQGHSLSRAALWRAILSRPGNESPVCHRWWLSITVLLTRQLTSTLHSTCQLPTHRHKIKVEALRNSWLCLERWYLDVHAHLSRSQPRGAGDDSWVQMAPGPVC